MITKKEVKDIQSLYLKKNRDERKLFVAEGTKLADELLNTTGIIQHIYATEAWLSKKTSINEPITAISNAELQRISNLQSPNDVLIIAKQKVHVTEPILNKNITLILDGIQDPGNLGTMIRTADWFGIKQIICSIDSADLYNPKVVQATMGSIFRVNCWYRDFAAIKFDQLPVFGALLEGKDIYAIPKPTEGVIIIGNESKGIREPLLSKITQPITIERAGEAESLNAAVAAGIIMAWLTK